MRQGNFLPSPKFQLVIGSKQVLIVFEEHIVIARLGSTYHNYHVQMSSVPLSSYLDMFHETGIGYIIWIVVYSNNSNLKTTELVLPQFITSLHLGHPQAT